MPGPNRSSGARRQPRPDSLPTKAHPLSPEDVDHQIGGLGHEPRLRIRFRTIPEVSRAPPPCPAEPPCPADHPRQTAPRRPGPRCQAGLSPTSPTKWVSPAPQPTNGSGAGEPKAIRGCMTVPVAPWLHRTEPLPMSRVASASYGATASSALHGSARPWHTKLDGPPCSDPPRFGPAALDGPAHRSHHPTLRTITSRRTGPRRYQEARQHSRRRRTSDHAPPAGRRQSAGHNRRA